MLKHTDTFSSYLYKYTVLDKSLVKRSSAAFSVFAGSSSKFVLLVDVV